MAHSPEVRGRARALAMAGWSLGRIARQTGVSRATLARWSAEESWSELREQGRALERESAALVLEMTRAARESRDPQQAYAAMQAAKVAGLAEGQPLYPPPAEVARVLLQQLVQHAELGPLVRKHRQEVIESVTRGVELLEVRA